MLNKKKINSIVEYIVIGILILISISKGGYYKRDALVGITIINVLAVAKYILNFKEENKYNILNYVLLFFSISFILPIIFSNAATMSGSIYAFFKVITGFNIFCIVQNSQNKEKFKNGIILSACIIALLGIDEMTFRLFDPILEKFGSGYLEEYNGTLSSVIQYANISGIIFVIASLFILEKITIARQEKNKLKKEEKNVSKEYVKDDISKENILIANKAIMLLSKSHMLEILYAFFVIVTFLTQSKMAILLLIVSSVIYKLIHKENKDIVKIAIICTFALLLSLGNLSRLKEYITTFDSTKTRLIYYVDAIKLWSTNISTILFGQGGNAFRMLYETVQTSGYISMEVHSLFIQILLESGLCGFALFVFAIYYSISKGKEKNSKLLLITLCVFAAFDVFFTYTYMLFVFYILLALCNVETKNCKKWQNIAYICLSSIITIFMLKISLGYILEPIDVENANISFEEQEKRISKCEKALSLDPWDMDIREKYEKACITYMDMLDIKNRIYGQDNIVKRKELALKLYNNALKKIDYEKNNKYAIDDYMRVTIKYVDYLVMASYDENVKEGYEYYLDEIMKQSIYLENNHKYNEAAKSINISNLKNVLDKYLELNLLLNSEKIDATLDIIKEKENINL